MFVRTYRRVAEALRNRWRSVGHDAGYSALEWVGITAAGMTFIGLIVVATETKVLEKIGIISGS